MKKKITVFMLAIMMVATAVITIESCSKSSNSSSTNSNSNTGDISKIVGTWRGSDEDETITLTFNSNGTGTSVVTYEGYYGTETETFSFTYSMTDSSHGTIIVAIPSYYYNNSYHYESFPLEINGPNLYVYEDDEYYGMEIIWMLTKV